LYGSFGSFPASFAEYGSYSDYGSFSDYPAGYPGTEGCELVCEGHNIPEAKCNAMSYCEFEGGYCWSAVGPSGCGGSSFNDYGSFGSFPSSFPAPCEDDDEKLESATGWKKGCEEAEEQKEWCTSNKQQGSDMREYCKETCGLCDGATECKDDDDGLESSTGWNKGCEKAEEKKGWCSSNKQQGEDMRENCKVTCSLCP